MLAFAKSLKNIWSGEDASPPPSPAEQPQLRGPEAARPSDVSSAGDIDSKEGDSRKNRYVSSDGDSKGCNTSAPSLPSGQTGDDDKDDAGPAGSSRNPDSEASLESLVHVNLPAAHERCPLSNIGVSPSEDDEEVEHACLPLDIQAYLEQAAAASTSSGAATSSGFSEVSGTGVDVSSLQPIGDSFNAQTPFDWTALHKDGKCRPCLYVNSNYGCIKGARCQYCHLPHTKPVKPGKGSGKQRS